jgi:hypothetical protein
LSDTTFSFPDLDLIVRRGNRYLSLKSLDETFRKMEHEKIELTWDTLRSVMLAVALGSDVK